MPVHVHADEEELFYVLGGEGISWQDGRTYRVRSGDCLLHRPGPAHTILGAGDGLDVLAFAQLSRTYNAPAPDRRVVAQLASASTVDASCRRPLEGELRPTAENIVNSST